MENRFKLRFSRMFRSSFGSCQSRNFSDIVENTVFDPPKSCSFRSMDSILQKTSSFRSICKLDSSGTIESIVYSTDLSLPRRKVSEICSSFLLQNQTCPPVSPVSPLKQSLELRGPGLKEETKSSEPKKKKKKKKKIQKKTEKKRESSICHFSSSSMESTCGGAWWYSSNDEEDDETEDETDLFFSSKSFSSDSSFSRSSRIPRRRGRTRRSSNVSLFPLQGKTKDSFAVVKKSTNPYKDFRASMVEMIVEKQIFSAKDLEQLLHSYLSLNSDLHHRVIVEVFTKILEALFPDR